MFIFQTFDNQQQNYNPPVLSKFWTMDTILFCVLGCEIVLQSIFFYIRTTFQKI